MYEMRMDNSLGYCTLTFFPDGERPYLYLGPDREHPVGRGMFTTDEFACCLLTFWQSMGYTLTYTDLD